ncbi:HEAT repeat domain-containing protein [Kitasatospora sp. MY 5-36]|uniref:HEAT repeat domain-containing protein n=1 Tax=Kitasatospora sp. MY 5-36 TaxID=1678027 RepID=UPI000670EDD2|nr:HEAT repeat domain-containing protein [Kitasatospora sp. MY 5-36]
MINNLEGLDRVDWSSMGHAYGPADEVPLWLEQMASPDPNVRERAFSRFYSSAHHQGDVYSCTAASLPFLFALANDPQVPDRAAVIRLMLSIGSAALDCDPDGVYYSPSGHASTPHADVVPRMRERIADFVRHAADSDPQVRQAAVPALGLFLDDAERAFALLRERLAAESGTLERLLVIETAATLAQRLPGALGPVTTWLAVLAADPALDADIRLAALVHQAACTPEAIDDSLVPTATGLLRQLTPEPEPEPEDEARPADCGQCTCTDIATEPAPDRGVPPQIAAVFDDLDRHGRVHAPTTELLTTFHRVLDARVPERTALLTAQLRSPDAATRHDAVTMTWDLIRSWRGNHTGLVLLLADCLLPDDPYTTAEAAETLGKLPPTLAEPAREALATLVEAHRTTHGPTVWAAPHPLLRRAHQQAVTALAGLGDERALPGLLTALDTGTDDWRAVQVAGHLPQATGELLPRLTRRLADADFSWPWGSATALMAALNALGDPAAVPALTTALTTAVAQEQWQTAGAALYALGSIGTGAASALETVRPLLGAEDTDLRFAAVKALWDIECDPADAVPRLTALLDTSKDQDAADVLGRMGRSAAAALPRLRQLSETGHVGIRVHAAAAIHDIGGPAEAAAVLPVLLEAWEENDSTAGPVVDCLQRMGPAAAPALPRIHAELALARRSGGFFGNIKNDEALLRAARAVIEHLA